MSEISVDVIRMMARMTREEKLEFALKLILDEVDYTRPNCSVLERVGAVLTATNINIAREALKKE